MISSGFLVLGASGGCIDRPTKASLDRSDQAEAFYANKIENASGIAAAADGKEGAGAAGAHPQQA
jgi:hypothetical protein